MHYIVVVTYPFGCSHFLVCLFCFSLIVMKLEFTLTTISIHCLQYKHFFSFTKLKCFICFGTHNKTIIFCCQFFQCLKEIELHITQNNYYSLTFSPYTQPLGNAIGGLLSSITLPERAQIKCDWAEWEYDSGLASSLRGSVQTGHCKLH